MQMKKIGEQRSGKITAENAESAEDDKLLSLVTLMLYFRPILKRAQDSFSLFPESVGIPDIGCSPYLLCSTVIISPSGLAIKMTPSHFSNLRLKRANSWLMPLNRFLGM